MDLYPRRVLKDIENESFVSFLDLARWLAASIVFLGHLRDPLFLGYGDVLTNDRTFAVSIWYFVTGWFGEAVIVFFVLSGFLVGGIASARMECGLFSPSNYAVDRLARLYVALLPALLFTASLDAVATHWFTDIGFYTHLHPMIQQKIHAQPYLTNMTLKLFTLNLLMQQTIATSTFGSNDPLWTISLEFWFYAEFGIALTSILVSGRRRLLGMVCFVAILICLGAEFPVYFGLWLCGVGAAFVSWRSVERPWIAATLFFAILILTRLGQEYFKQGAAGIVFRNYLVALAFAWLLVSMRSVRTDLLKRLGTFNRFMAEFSFSLYLIHFPLMLFVLGALYETGRFEPIAHGYSPTSVEGISVYMIVIAVVYSTAWLFAQVTERQTWKLRRSVKGLLAKRSIRK